MSNFLRETFLEILGRRFSFSSDEERWHPFIARLWSGFLAGPGDVDARAEVSVADDEREGWVFRFNDSLKVITPDAWAVANHLRFHLMNDAMEHARGLFVHAGVVSQGENTVVLAGPSGSGKTTVCLDLVERGWSLLGDDLTRIDESGRAVPVASPPSVKDIDKWEAHKRRWADLSWLPTPASGFLVDTNGLVVPSEPRRPTHLVVTTYERNSGLDIEELSVAECILLMGEFVKHLDTATMALMRDVCGSARCLRMKHGGQAAAWLDRELVDR